jgi:hypothetical protein
VEFNGGEGGIRTPDSLATMSDFESGAFNRALPPLRVWVERNGQFGDGLPGNRAPSMRCGWRIFGPLMSIAYCVEKVEMGGVRRVQRAGQKLGRP